MKESKDKPVLQGEKIMFLQHQSDDDDCIKSFAQYCIHWTCSAYESKIWDGTTVNYDAALQYL